MKTSLRKAIRIFAFVCVTIISNACQPSCEEGECVPPNGAIQECHDGGGEYDYTRCTCIR